MSYIPYTWGSNAPKGFTVTAEKVKISHIGTPGSQVLFVCNLDDTSPVFLSFDDPTDNPLGRAEVEKGIAVMPGTVFRLDSTGLPMGSDVWAVSVGSVKISVQD